MPSQLFLYALLAAGLAATAAPIPAAGAQTVAPATALDAGMYTSFILTPNYRQADGSVCGRVQGSDGCYGICDFDNFGHLGAAMQGAGMYVAPSTEWRYFYLVDSAAGSTGTSVEMRIYKQTIVITPPYASVTCTLSRTVPLPLTGGPKVKVYMAGDAPYLFIGTSQSPRAVRFTKGNSVVTQVGGMTPRTNVSSITADQNGLVHVTYGGIVGTNGYSLFGSDGSLVRLSTGALFSLNAANGISTLDVPANASAPTPEVSVRYGAQARDAQPYGSLDAGLSVGYAFDSAYQHVTVSVCGTVAGSKGCHGGATLGAFGKIGAMIEGTASTNAKTSTVSRRLYVVDQLAGGTGSTSTAMDVYEITEVITPPSVTVKVALVKSVPLHLTGASGARTFMAANSSDIYIGNDKSSEMEQFDKVTLAAEPIDGSFAPDKDSSVNADPHGFVAMDYGTEDGGAFVIQAPPNEYGDGGWGNPALYFFNTTQGLSTNDIVLDEYAPVSHAPRVHVNFHH